MNKFKDTIPDNKKHVLEQQIDCAKITNNLTDIIENLKNFMTRQIAQIDFNNYRTFRACIELVPNSVFKYEAIKENNIETDKILAQRSTSPFATKFPYGYLVNTLEEDGDAIDVVLCMPSEYYPQLHVGIFIDVVPICCIDMIDTGQADRKIIALPCMFLNRYNEYKYLEIANLAQCLLVSCIHLLNYKEAGVCSIHNIKGHKETILFIENNARK